MDLKQPLESKGVAIKAFDFTTSQQSQQQGKLLHSQESLLSLIRNHKSSLSKKTGRPFYQKRMNK